MAALTTLANVRQWVYTGSTDQDGNPIPPSTLDDALLTRLINSCSAAILSYLQRPKLTKTTYTEVRSGVGNATMMLRNWPVSSVQSLVNGSQSISAAPAFGQNGFQLQPADGTNAGTPQNLVLNGYCYQRGNSNVQITYTAGYWIPNEPQTVTLNGSNYTASTNMVWAQDEGVTLANGTALTKVASAPAAMQYAVDPLSGLYSFNVAQNNAAILISYSYTPDELQQACIEWVAERYRYRDRIGQRSKSLGGNETASYDLSAIPAFIEAILNPFCKPFPL